MALLVGRDKCSNDRGDRAALEYFLNAMGCDRPDGIAEGLIQRFGSMSGVFSATSQELLSVSGLTERTAAFFVFVRPFYRRALAEPFSAGVRDRGDLEKFVSAYVARECERCDYVFCFGKRGGFICADRFAAGSVRSIIGAAARRRAASVVWARNEPPMPEGPSTERLAVVAKTITAAEKLRITFLDYMECGAGRVFSLRRALGGDGINGEGAGADLRLGITSGGAASGTKRT